MRLSNYNCVRWDRKLPRVTETLRLFQRRTSQRVLPPLPAPRRGRLGLTSGRLCWRPALRRPASMSGPRSSRPPWALLSYYSHSSGCCRGFQTSKRTFTLPLSLSSLSLSLSSTPSFLSLAPLLLRLFDRAVRGAKWRGLFHLAFSCRACFSK